MSTKASKGATAIATSRLPKERQHFALLTLSNPNYFGNLTDSLFNSGVKKPLINQTTYEQLHCVGLNPQFDYAEAIVDVKQDSGYSGGICTAGSREFVRFYADYAGSGVWTDLGVASVRVHDIGGPKPLSYKLRVPVIDPPRHFCLTNNIIKLRAILSWNLAPPPGAPNYVPVWGNTLDVHVQIRPFYFWPWYEFLAKFEKLNLPPELGELLNVIDPKTELTVNTKKLDLVEKSALYAKADVPAHRYAFPELKHAQMQPLMLASAGSFMETLAKSPETFENLISILEKPAHDATEFEEVTCCGYRPESDSVGAVIKIKKSAGYNGSLCTTGSPEYVAFWAEVGAVWHFLGMAAVQVHDLIGIPSDGVQYAVNRPVDTRAWRQLCLSGAKVVRLRAVLSWSTPPSTTDPDEAPFWGNHVDTHIQLRPGDPATVSTPQLLNISGFSVSSDPTVNEIDPVTGLTVLNEAPFGRILAIRGVLPGYATYDRYYRIEVKRQSEPDTAYRAITDPQTLRIFQDNGSAVVDCSTDPGFQVECFPTISPVDLGDGLGAVWYKYQNYQSGGITQHVEDQTLGYWHTNAAQEGLWNIRVTFLDGTVETVPSAVLVCLDNTPPTVNASWSAAVEATCNKTPTNTTVVGAYSVADTPGTPEGSPHLSGISIIVIPNQPGTQVSFGTAIAAGATNSTSRSYPTLPGAGESGSFAMRSATECGYALRFVASDRTNVGYISGPNFGLTNFSAEDDLGICVNDQLKP